MHHDVHHDKKEDQLSHKQRASHSFTVSNSDLLGAGGIGSNLQKTLETHWNKSHLHRNLSYFISHGELFVSMSIYFWYL